MRTRPRVVSSRWCSTTAVRRHHRPRQVLRRGERRRRDRRRGGAPDRRARHQLHQLAGVVHPAGVDRGSDHLAGPRHRRSTASRAAARLRLARRGALGAGPVLRGVRGPAERGLRMGHGHAGLRDRRHRDHPPGRDLARVALRGYRRGRPGPVHRLRVGAGEERPRPAGVGQAVHQPHLQPGPADPEPANGWSCRAPSS